MASKLLNVLDKLESGRQDLIRIMHNLGFDLPHDASLQDIAEELEDNVDAEHIHFYIDSNMNTQYYDNPLDDPDIIKPTDFERTFADILKEAPIATFNNQTFYPYCLFLFSTDAITSTICSSQYINPSTGAAVIRLGYQSGWGVVTSDGASYYMNSNTSTYEHTWNTTKDIIDPDTNIHYKYVIGYVRSRDHYIANTGLGTNHKLYAIFVSAQLANGGNSGIVQTVSPYTKCIRYLDHLDNAPTDNMNRYYVAPGRAIAMIEIDKERTGTTPIVDMTNTIICESFINHTSNVGYSVSFLSSTMYIKNPIFKLNWYQSGDLTNHSLKYLEITDPDRQNQLGLTLDRYMPPLLKNVETLLDAFMVINQDCFKYYGSKKELILNNVVQLNGYALRGLSTHVLVLPKYVSHTNSNAFADAYIQVLDLPAITHLDTALNLNTNILREISMEELVEATANISIGPKVTTLYLPKCVKFPQAMINSARSLVNLTIGEGFKGNLNMQYCGNLSYESWLNLFNNLATLAEGESYTLLLPAKNTYSTNTFSVTTELENIAIEKGWTVNHG